MEKELRARLVAAAAGGAASAAAGIATGVAATAIAASTTAGSELELLLGGGSDGFDVPFEADGMAGEGMVEIHAHGGGGYFEDGADDSHAVGGHHGEGVSDFDHFVVEFSVDFEEVFVESGDVFVGALSEGFFGGGFYVEFVADGFSFEFFFERKDEAAHYSIDEGFGLVVINLMDELLGAVGVDFI